MMQKMNNAIRNFWRKDRASMTQVLLISLMIPTTVALIVSTALTQLFVQYQDNRRTNMVSATEVAASYLLGDINTKLPTRYLDMSPTQLAAETKKVVESMNAETYVSSFTVDDNGWIQAVVVVDLLDSPGEPLSWAVQFRPTSATVFKGFEESTGRPLWAFTTGTANPNASLEELGLFEQVPVVSSVDDYPSINRPGSKASAPQNLRILRSDTFGVVLAWDKPLNATEAVLTGYRIDSTKNTDCFNLAPDSGAEVLADGYIVLSTDSESTDYQNWRCSSTNDSNLVSVRGIGQIGTGVAAFVNLGQLPTYDLDNLVPVAPSGLAYTRTGANHVLTWNEQTCNFGYNIEFRISKTTAGNVEGNYGYAAEYASYTPANGKYTFVLPTEALNGRPGVEQGSTQGWKVDARCLSSTFGASSASEKSNEAKVTTPIQVAPNVAGLTVTQTASTGTASWGAATNCPAISTPQYRLVYSQRNDDPSTQVIRDWTPNYTSGTVVTNLGTTGTVRLEARCYSTNGNNPVIGASQNQSRSWTWDATPVVANINIAGTMTGTVTWSAATGCPATTTPQYKLSYTKRNDAASTTTILNWASGVTTAQITTNSGTFAAVQLETRCASGANYSSSSTIDSAEWRSGVTAPVGVVTGVTNNGGGRVSFSAFPGCASGSTPEYRVYRSTTNGSATSSYGAWFSGRTYFDLSVTEGTPQAASVQARCAIGSDVSTSTSNSATTSWTLGLSGPGVSRIWTSNGTYTAGVLNWNRQSCTGSDQYYITITRQSNSGSTANSGGWATSSSWSRPGLTAGGYIYWNWNARCQTSWATSGTVSSQLRAPATST